MLGKLSKEILIYGIASSITRFIGVFLVPIYTKIFTPEQYGTIDLISTVVAVLTIFGMLQLESAVSRYYYEIKTEENRKKYISTALWTLTFISLIITFTAIILSDFISEILFNSKIYTNIICLAVILIPTTNLFAFFTVIIRFQKKSIIYSIFMFIQFCTTITVSIWLVKYENKGIIGVYYGQLSGIILAVIAMYIYLRKKILFYYNFSIIKKMFKYSIPSVPAVVTGWINAYANRFVMLGYLSVVEIGLYTVALKIASVFKIIESAFRMAWEPFLWETFEKENHREILKKIPKYVTTIIFSLVFLLSLFSKEILRIFTTESYYEASPLIAILGFSFGLGIIRQTVGLGPGIVKKTIYNTYIYTIGVIINILSLFLFVPIIDLIGVPFSLLLSNIVLLILSWYYSEKLYFIGFYKKSFIASFIILSTIMGISALLELNLWLKILISLCLLAIITLIMLKRYLHDLNNKTS